MRNPDSQTACLTIRAAIYLLPIRNAPARCLAYIPGNSFPRFRLSHLMGDVSATGLPYWASGSTNTLSAGGFAVRLTAGQTPPPQPPIAQSSSSPKRGWHGPTRILLVEDNSADVWVIKDLLGSSGMDYELVVATDGQSAMQILERIEADPSAPRFDLALVDLNLPKYSGDELLAWVRQTERSRDMPVLIVTSSQSTEDKARAQELGATGYFTKPMKLEGYSELTEMIEDVLPGRDRTQ